MEYSGMIESRGRRRRCFNNVLLFTAVFSVSSLLLEAVKSYTVTSLEKQFGLSSTKSGLFLSCNEIGYLSAFFFFSHFGGRRFIPRILSRALAVYGLASLMSGRLHFMNPVPVPQVEDLASNYSSPQSVTLCRDSVQDNERCPAMKDQATDNGHWVYNVLAVLMVIQGVGKSPRFPLGLPYVDNNSCDKQQSSLLTGIIITAVFLGPLVALVLGGWFSDIPVDLSDMPRSVLRILKNPVVDCLLFGSASALFSVGGYTSFAPKYLESQFATSAAEANFILGLHGFESTLDGTLSKHAFLPEKNANSQQNIKTINQRDDVVSLTALGKVMTRERLLVLSHRNPAS